jgi:hypothetical protein
MRDGKKKKKKKPSLSVYGRKKTRQVAENSNPTPGHQRVIALGGAAPRRGVPEPLGVLGLGLAVRAGLEFLVAEGLEPRGGLGELLGTERRLGVLGVRRQRQRRLGRAAGRVPVLKVDEKILQ